MFEAIQKSYELLLRVIENGTKIRVSSSGNDGGDGVEASVDFGFDRMRLLVQTQLLICRRYEVDMKKMKYPSYSVLLGCLQVPSDAKRIDISQSWARRHHADFVRSAAELVFRTCLISPQNAAEIISQSGLVILCSLLRTTMEVIDSISPAESNGNFAPVDTFLEIIFYSLRTLSGILFFDHGREALTTSAEICSSLMQVFYECVCGSRWENSPIHAARIKQAALEGICHLAKDSKCQRFVVEFGVLWPLIGSLLLYDSSVESGSAPQVDVSNVSAANNGHAMLAVQAIGDVSTTQLTEALDTIFTPPLSELLRSRRYKEFLQMVNSNVEEAYVIWNSDMRSQLEVLVQEQTTERSQNPGQRTIEEEVECLKSHQYEALLNEVIIGGVYVRVFNKVGVDAIRRVKDVSAFATALIDFAKNEVETAQNEPENSEMLDLSVGALKVLIHSGTLGDDFLASATELPDLVLSLMSLPEKANSIGCEMGADLSSKQGFADCVARQGSLWRLIQLLEAPENTDGQINNFDQTSVPKRKLTGWSMLEAMSAYGPVTSLLLESSSWLELLGVLCGYQGFTTSFFSRLGAAKALSRMLWDNTASNGLSSVLSRFLPLALVTLLRDSPEIMVNQFDGEADGPELIWDSSMRSELRSVLSEQLDAIVRDRESGGPAPFDLDPTVEVFYEKLHNEVFVGGVFISRFLKDPTYQLRDPTGFLDALLKQREKELEKFWPGGGLSVSGASTEIVAHGSEDSLHDLTTAAVYVCKVRETLCDKLAPWGYCSRSMESIQKALDRQMVGSPLMESVRLLHVATNSRVNVDAISSISSTDGTYGIVDFMIKAIGGGPLHADAAFFVDFLFLLFKNALGDVSRAGSQSYPPLGHGFSVAMAPSPAPGEGPVRHNREKINLGDDPLAMFGISLSAPAPPAAAQAPPQQRPATQMIRAPTQGMAQHLLNANAPVPSAHHVQQQSPYSFTPANPYGNSALNSYNHGQVQNATGFHQQNPPQPVSSTGALRPRSGFDQPQQQYQPPQPPPQYQQQQVQQRQGHHQFQSNLQGSSPYNMHSNVQQYHAQAQQYQPPPQGNFQSPLRQDSPVQHQDQHQQFPLSPALATGQHQSQYQHQSNNPQATPQRSATEKTGPAAGSQLFHGDMQQSISTERAITSSNPTGSQWTASPHANWSQSSPQVKPTDPMHSPSPGMPSVGHPPDAPQHQFYESSMSGTGIDARSPIDPAQTAEERAVSSDGAPGAASGRVTLLHQALACRLCQFLVNDFLENVSLEEIKDPAAGKVHAVNLLKLLTMDPGYGMKFKLILKDLPAWSKYKSQDHSLMLATTKRTDYFLTAGEQANPTLMLTEGTNEDDLE
eukprot:scaffold2433_cov159-Amphora_coffeaeformis.AAC.7